MAVARSAQLVEQRNPMTGKAEIPGIAQALRLSPQIVEKDYAPGQALAGIFAHRELKDSRIFKGGTCLINCYFETFRFSEDPDFTLLNETHLDEAFLKRAIAEIAGWILKQGGLDFPVNPRNFEIIQNRRGNPGCRGKLT